MISAWNLGFLHKNEKNWWCRIRLLIIWTWLLNREWQIEHGTNVVIQSNSSLKSLLFANWLFTTTFIWCFIWHSLLLLRKVRGQFKEENSQGPDLSVTQKSILYDWCIYYFRPALSAQPHSAKIIGKQQPGSQTGLTNPLSSLLSHVSNTAD